MRAIARRHCAGEAEDDHSPEPVSLRPVIAMAPAVQATRTLNSSSRVSNGYGNSTAAAALPAALRVGSRISPLPTLKRRYYIDPTSSCNAEKRLLARMSNVSCVYRKKLAVID